MQVFFTAALLNTQAKKIAAMSLSSAQQDFESTSE